MKMLMMSVAVAAMSCLFLTNPALAQPGGGPGGLVLVQCGVRIAVDCDQLVTSTALCTNRDCFFEIGGGGIYADCRTSELGDLVNDQTVATGNFVMGITAPPAGGGGTLFWTQGQEVTCGVKSGCNCNGYNGSEIDPPCKTGDPNNINYVDLDPAGGVCVGGGGGGGGGPGGPGGPGGL